MPDRVPYISPEVITYLLERFPLVPPQLSWDEKRVWFYAGEQKVIAHLKELFESQEANVLNHRILDDV